MKLIKTIALCLFLCVIGSTAFSQERYKTVIVYSFTKYLQWPEAYREGPFVITVLGNSSIFSEMKQNLQDKSLGNQKIVVYQATSVSSIKPSHIIYIPTMQSNLLEAVNRAIGDSPTLVISEKKGLISEGSDINFFKIGSQLKYEIAPKHIEAKSIHIIGNSLLRSGIIYDDPSSRGLELESVDDVNLPK